LYAIGIYILGTTENDGQILEVRPYLVIQKAGE